MVILMIILLQAAFDHRSASVLVSDLTQCLESSGEAPPSPSVSLDVVASIKLNQKLDRLYQDSKTAIVQFWEPKLTENNVRPSSLKFGPR